MKTSEFLVAKCLMSFRKLWYVRTDKGKEAVRTLYGRREVSVLCGRL